MTEGGHDPPQPARRLVEEAELAQYRCAIIVNALARQPVIDVERVHCAKRKLHSSAGRWEAAPWAEMRTPDRHLQHQALGSCVPVLHFYCQVGYRAHQLAVVRPYAVA